MTTLRRPDPIRAGIYCRISQDRRGEGLGVERQRKDCAKLAAKLGWPVLDVYPDNDISAYRPRRRRPQYERLLADIQAGRITHLLVWHTDRLNRTPFELERLMQILDGYHVSVESVTAGRVDLTTAAGRLFARAMGAVATYESDHKSERVSAKMREIALTGAPWKGGIYRPYGYHTNRLTIDPNEAMIVRELVRRFLRGEAVSVLAKALNARGIPTSTGGPWSSTSVKRLITGVRIAGWRGTPMPKSQAPQYWCDFLAKAQWPGIVTRRDVEKVRVLMTDETRCPGSRHRYLLHGIALCGQCGMTMRSELKDSPTRRYWCMNKSPGRCGRVTVTAKIETDVVDRLHVAVAHGLIDRLRACEESALHAPAQLVRDAETQLTILKHERDDGVITRQEWLLRSNRLARRIDTLKAGTPMLTRTELTQLARRPFSRVWQTATIGEQRAILQTLAAAITVPVIGSGRGHGGSRIHIAWRA